MQTYLQQRQPTNQWKNPNPVTYKTLSLMQLVHSSIRTMREYIKSFARLKKASTRWKTLYSGSTLTLSHSDFSNCLRWVQVLWLCSFQTKHGHSQTETVFQRTLQRIKKEKCPFFFTQLRENSQWGTETQHSALCRNSKKRGVVDQV